MVSGHFSFGNTMWGGFWVDFDVELGHGTPVAHVVAAAYSTTSRAHDARLHAHWPSQCW